MAVDLDDRVININKHHGLICDVLVGSVVAEQWCGGREVQQKPRRDGVELADVPERKRTQE
ncbi:MAG: hypothetical protein H7270_12295 [Dermatophilaceae bacterium]|nr:hypothetical protein [Dermatophilaceae bacterium]